MKLRTIVNKGTLFSRILLREVTSESMVNEGNKRVRLHETLQVRLRKRRRKIEQTEKRKRRRRK